MRHGRVGRRGNVGGLGRDVTPLRIRDWVPEQYARLWNQLSFDARTLLWWTSFNLLSEEQLDSREARYRMEDVFVDGITEPIKRITSAVVGKKHAETIKTLGRF